MGSKQSKAYRPPLLQKQAWKEKKDPPKKPPKPEHGRFRLLINNLTNEELEEYSVGFSSLSQFQKYIEFFQWRQRQDNIVNTKFLNHQLTKQFCNTNYGAKVYIERIPVRLSDISDIPFPENLYLLFSSLEGFQKLYQSVGYFAVSQDLICMDKDGRVKTWLHSDLSRCHPSGRSLDELHGYRKEEALETKMVDEIVKMVEENTEQEKPSITVTDFLRNTHKNKSLTFKSAKQAIVNYAQQCQVQIPNYFESVIGIFDQSMDNDEQSAQQQINHYSPDQQFHGQIDNSHQIVDNWQSYHLRAFPSQKDALKSNPQNQSIPQSVQPMAYQPIIAETYIKPMGSIQYGSINHSNYKVHFNYNSMPSRSIGIEPMTPIVSLVTPQYHQIKRYDSLQNDKWCQPKTNSKPISQNLKNLLINDKIMYSDSTSTYELDSQIAEDMLKYLNY